jgi:hypothetical protein
MCLEGRIAMYPRYLMVELARQIVRSQHDDAATRPKEPPSARTDSPEITGSEATAIWRMGIVLALIAAILGCLAMVKG